DLLCADGREQGERCCNEESCGAHRSSRRVGVRLGDTGKMGRMPQQGNGPGSIDGPAEAGANSTHREASERMLRAILLLAALTASSARASLVQNGACFNPLDLD